MSSRTPTNLQSARTSGQVNHGLPRWPVFRKDRSLQESELKCAIRERSRVAVSCRYVIDSAPLEETPNSCCAVNAITGERVYLQFFPNMQNEFKNCIRMHNALSESQFICRYSTTRSRCTTVSRRLRRRLLEVITDERRYPPCLVLERGDYTLLERLRQDPPSMFRRLAVLYAVRRRHSVLMWPDRPFRRSSRRWKTSTISA